MIDPATLPEHPHDAYATLHTEAIRLAGEPGDIARRVAVHYAVWLDSRGNHAFPLVALHGALWAAGFFDTTGRLGDALRVRYFYNPRERAVRMGMLHGFAEGFKSVNRQVFVDTWTNYFYTKYYGDHPHAADVLHPDLFAALRSMHDATRAGQPLTPAQQRHVFLQSLQYEQEVTVAPGVQEEVAKFDCPILTFLCVKPVVRFRYFPAQTYLFFRDFTNTTERVAKALRSYDLAAGCGWSVVSASVRDYGLLPDGFFVDPIAHVRALTLQGGG
ncbi:MAG: hypothetical protein AB7V46_00445 [Thermomicrobiales bacterium]